MSAPHSARSGWTAERRAVATGLSVKHGGEPLLAQGIPSQPPRNWPYKGCLEQVTFSNARRTLRLWEGLRTPRFWALPRLWSEMRQKSAYAGGTPPHPPLSGCVATGRESPLCRRARRLRTSRLKPYQRWSPTNDLRQPGVRWLATRCLWVSRYETVSSAGATRCCGLRLDCGQGCDRRPVNPTRRTHTAP